MENLSVHGRMQHLRVRCPECMRTYTINSSEIKEAKPRFACTQCQTQFWLAFPECLHYPEVVGFPMVWMQPTPEQLARPEPKPLKSCPKCSAQVEQTLKECPACGVIFEKFKSRASAEESDLTTSALLKQMWQSVLDRYEDESKHQAFIRACESEGNLTYALNRYSTILEATPYEPRARRLRESVKALMELKARVLAPKQGNPDKTKGWLVLHVLLIGTALSLIAAGWLWPQFRNVIGFGAVLLFISAGLHFYSRD